MHDLVQTWFVKIGLISLLLGIIAKCAGEVMTQTKLRQTGGRFFKQTLPRFPLVLPYRAGVL